MKKVVHVSSEDLQKYLNYLKAVSSAFSVEVIAKAGVDRKSTDYLDAAFGLLKNRWSE